MERVMALHTVQKANEDMDGTIVQNKYDDIDYKPHPLSKSVDSPLSDVRSVFECKLSILDIATKPDVVAIAANCLTK